MPLKFTTFSFSSKQKTENTRITRAVVANDKKKVEIKDKSKKVDEKKTVQTTSWQNK